MLTYFIEERPEVLHSLESFDGNFTTKSVFTFSPFVVQASPPALKILWSNRRLPELAMQSHSLAFLPLDIRQQPVFSQPSILHSPVTPQTWEYSLIKLFKLPGKKLGLYRIARETF